MLTVLIVILHDTERLPDLLKAWKRAGVPGATILPSMGSFQAQHLVRRRGLGGLLNVFDQNKAQQRTLLSLIDDPEILELAISEADRVVKGFDRPQSGILFTLPAGQILGLKKWGRGEQEDKEGIEAGLESADRTEANLLNWFNDDVRNAFGEDAIVDWTKQRRAPVSEIVRSLHLNPTIVRMDTPLQEVFAEFISNPNVETACVVNNEERLMGLIDIPSLSDAMLSPVMPIEFVKDSSSYEQALSFANIKGTYLASDIMSDPVFAFLTDTLEDTYHKMKEGKLSGMPVVDKFYRVKGYVSVLELMSVCFPVDEEEEIRGS